MTSQFIDSTTSSFSEDFIINDNVSADVARAITINTVTDNVVDAARTVRLMSSEDGSEVQVSLYPEVISVSMNNLLRASLELQKESDADMTPEQRIALKEQSNDILQNALSLKSLLDERPIYQVNSDGTVATVFDPLSNTEVPLIDKDNQKFYDSALDQLNILQADYVGLSLDEWIALDDDANAEQIKADRLNAVRIGISYEDYVDFANKNANNPEEWDIYPFVDYEDSDFVPEKTSLDYLLSQPTNKGLSFDDFANVLFNQTLFSPSAVVPNDSYSEVNRADPIVYSSTDPGSALYIAAMDSVFQDGDEIKSYRTINPNPYKFQIDIPELQDDEGNIYYEDANYSAEGTQVSYLVNYTYGNLQGNAQDGYTFTWKSQDPGSTATAFSPELVGHDVDEFDIVLKYISEYDLLAYGATVVEPDGDDVVAVGDRTFSWDSDPENIVDKYGQLSSPLVDLDGNTITKAGWYDFTLRPTLQTENKLGRDGDQLLMSMVIPLRSLFGEMVVDLFTLIIIPLITE